MTPCSFNDPDYFAVQSIALQNLSDLGNGSIIATASWSAVPLHRFSPIRAGSIRWLQDFDCAQGRLLGLRPCCAAEQGVVPARN
jgi:hypothetical protein